jgi:capsular exopolysaccharide synthesis family protein
MGGLGAERLSALRVNANATAAGISLEREAAAKRAAYDRLAQISMESAQTAGAEQEQVAQAAIVDRAEPPATPTSPNRPLLLTMALLASVAIGLTTIVVQEMMVTGLRTVEDVEDQLGVPVLAAVPMAAKIKSPADLLLAKPTSLYAESFRIARASILGVGSPQTIKVIAVTSALPGEGKSTTALSLARTMASKSTRTLLIDCDLRRATQKQLSGGDAIVGPGLWEVLTGTASVEDAIQQSTVTGLDQLFIREPHYTSGDAFGDGRMERLLHSLREKYDHIILDLPPLVGLADSRFLAVLADTTAVIVKWDETPARAVASAIGWLRSDGATVAGVIYTFVDPASDAIGGLHYSKKYSEYYGAT